MEEGRVKSKKLFIIFYGLKIDLKNKIRKSFNFTKSSKEDIL
ncbi:hypothetical protein TPHV1_210016 [Treponema phagedenis]|uniref:Uncharacterized protein n=1 Tax=Treponema phagedenis TaxID=162 RepID=A0A0B7GTG1_TREPH|nr:hypothetical protein TPHV1_210016 [Treponema phagedenis]